MYKIVSYRISGALKLLSLKSPTLWSSPDHGLQSKEKANKIDIALFAKTMYNSAVISAFMAQKVEIMEYMNIAETAEKWGISARRLQTLCANGKVEGVTRFGKVWMIPKSTQKPVEGRTKASKEDKGVLW